MTARKARSNAKDSLLASIVQVLVDTGYLEVADVGKLAQTTRELNTATTDESIWVSLCEREGIKAQDFPRSILEAKGHCWLYQHWSCPVVKRRPPRDRLAPPSCTADQIHFSLHLRHKGAPIYSQVVSGEDLSEFLGKGNSTWPLKSPIIIGKAEWETTPLDLLTYRYGYEPGDRLGLPVVCPTLDFHQLDVRIHMLRCTDSAMCCVFKSKPKRKDIRFIVHPLVKCERITPQARLDLSRPYDRVSCSLGPSPQDAFDSLPLRDSLLSNEIMMRFAEPLGFSCDIGFDFVDTNGEDHMAITAIQIGALYPRLHENKLSSELAHFESEQEAMKHGVTLLHILSELQANEFP